MAMEDFCHLSSSQAQETVCAYCSQCCGEIYPGEEFYYIDGLAVCPDCLSQFAEHYFRLCLKCQKGESYEFE